MLDHVTTAVQSPFSYACDPSGTELRKALLRADRDVVWVEPGERRAGLDGSWTSLGSYPDEHLERVVTGRREALRSDGGDLPADLHARRSQPLPGPMSVLG